MADDITKNVLERIPFIDGGMRRRLFAGAIVTITIFVNNTDIGLINRTVSIDKILNSWIAGVLFLLFIFVMGSVVEIVNTFFIKRAMGSVIWTLRAPLEVCRLENPVLYVIFVTLTYLFVAPVIFGYAITRGIYGHRFAVDLKLDDVVIRNIGAMPKFMRGAFHDPFGDTLDAAWLKTSEDLTPVSRRVIVRKFALCEDVAMFFAAAICSASIILNTGKGADLLQQMFRSEGFAQVMMISMITYVLIVVAAILYFIAIRSAMSVCIELFAYEAETGSQRSLPLLASPQ